MKKILSILMVLTVIVAAFAGCGSKAEDYSLAIGVVVTENLAKAKVTETVASIVTDADGKIVLCRLDCVDYTAKYAEDGTLDTTAPVSKAALGDNYGAMPAGTWYAQGAALESYVVGKTQAEVAAIALEGGVVADADLKASCSINVTDLLKAIDNAFKSEHKASFTASGALTAGLSADSSVKDTTTEDGVKGVKLSTTFASAVMEDGKVVAAILDTAEPELKEITENGAASLAFGGSKRELGENYGAMPAGTWYVQADAYVKAAIGLTADDVATLASEGVAGCTIYAGGYKAAIESAVKAGR